MACQPGPPVEKVPPMRNKGLMAGLIEGTTMVNNPFNKALFVMGVPYMGAPVDWPKKLQTWPSFALDPTGLMQR